MKVLTKTRKRKRKPDWHATLQVTRTMTRTGGGGSGGDDDDEEEEETKEINIFATLKGVSHRLSA